MSDYRPTYPVGFEPRYLRGEYSIGMDSARQLQEVKPHIIPDQVACERVPPGAAVRQAGTGQAHRWNNQSGAALAASLDSAAIQSRRAKVAARVLRAPKPEKPPKEDRQGALRARVLDWMRGRGTPATRHEIAAGLGIAHEATRNPINRLLATGLIKSRRYSLADRPGHQAQYFPADATWPPLPQGATALGQRRTSRRRPTE